jgi:hypothetical protein
VYISQSINAFILFMYSDQVHYMDLLQTCGTKPPRHINGRVDFTCKPLIRSSLVWEAEIHILALASSSGVAGNATVTTAT